VFAIHFNWPGRGEAGRDCDSMALCIEQVLAVAEFVGVDSSGAGFSSRRLIRTGRCLSTVRSGGCQPDPVWATAVDEARNVLPFVRFGQARIRDARGRDCSRCTQNGRVCTAIERKKSGFEPPFGRALRCEFRARRAFGAVRAPLPIRADTGAVDAFIGSGRQASLQSGYRRS